jgi:hypothetical protein
MTAASRSRSSFRFCLVALVTLSATAHAASPAPPPAAGGSPWTGANRITLEFSEEGAGSASYIFENAANGDFRIEETETPAHEAKRSGTLYMVGGRGMAVRGLDLPLGGELAAVDGPFLRLELARTLLERGVPGGPASIKAPVQIDSREAAKAIQVETPTAAAQFPPPWRLKGSVTKEAQEVTFDLVLKSETFLKSSSGTTFHFHGTWKLGAVPASFPDDTSLSGWTSYLLAPVLQKDSGDYEPGAVPLPTVPTLGALRKVAQPHTAG